MDEKKEALKKEEVMKMNQNEMFENLKTYIENEIRVYESYGKKNNAPISSLRDRCYGAMMFSSYLVSSDKENLYWWDDNVGKWWDDEIRPRLYNL